MPIARCNRVVPLLVVLCLPGALDAQAPERAKLRVAAAGPVLPDLETAASPLRMGENVSTPRSEGIGRPLAGAVIGLPAGMLVGAGIGYLVGPRGDVPDGCMFVCGPSGPGAGAAQQDHSTMNPPGAGFEQTSLAEVPPARWFAARRDAPPGDGPAISLSAGAAAATVGQTIAGAGAGGLAGTAIGAGIGYAMDRAAAPYSDVPGLGGALAGAAIGLTLGAPLGAHLANRRAGNVALGVGSSLLAGAAVLGAGFLVEAPIAAAVLAPLAQVGMAAYVERATAR